MLVLAFAVPALWVAAALLAGGLPTMRTAQALRRRAAWALIALTAAGVGTAVGVTTIGGPSAADWRYLQLALFVGPAIVALAVAVPRVIRLRDASRGLAQAGLATPAPPAVRAAAAHPLVAGPVQTTAFGALVLPVVASGQPAPGAAAGLVVAFAAAAAILLAHNRTRHRRLTATALIVGPESSTAGHPAPPWQHRRWAVLRRTQPETYSA